MSCGRKIEFFHKPDKVVLVLSIGTCHEDSASFLGYFWFKRNAPLNNEISLCMGKFYI
jgi:hypothetical protein